MNPLRCHVATPATQHLFVFENCSPILAPLIVVESATYGQTREGVDERLLKVQRSISDLLGLQNRKDMEMPLTRDENKRLMQLRPLIAELR